MQTSKGVANSGIIKLIRQSFQSLHNSNQPDAFTVRYQAPPTDKVNFHCKRERLHAKKAPLKAQ